MRSLTPFLVGEILGCRARIHGYTDHGGAQHAPVKKISWLKDLQDGAIFVLGRFGAIHGLMQVRIELLSGWIETLDPQLGDVV
jgi:hypothetical protein